MRSRMIWFAFFVVVIDAMGIGLLMPVLPDILEELTGGDISQTAQVAMALTVVYAGMQFLFGPLIGSLSDRFGRRPVLLLSIGAGLHSARYCTNGFLAVHRPNYRGNCGRDAVHCCRGCRRFK